MKKCSVGFSVVLQTIVDREPYLWWYWLPEWCIKQCYDKPPAEGLRLEEVWAEGAMNRWHSCILYLIQMHWYAAWKHKFQKHSWFNPLTRLSIHTADNSLLPLLYLNSVSTVSGCYIINIHSCHQGRMLWIRFMAYHPHIEFHYCKILTYLSYDYRSFSNISGIDLSVSTYRKVSYLQPN